MKPSKKVECCDGLVTLHHLLNCFFTSIASTFLELTLHLHPNVSTHAHAHTTNTHTAFHLYPQPYFIKKIKFSLGFIITSLSLKV